MINTRLFTALFISLWLMDVGSSRAAENESLKQEWQPTTVSEQTQAKVNAGVEQYQICLNDETKTHINDQDDSRKVTDLILRNCEKKLIVVKEAFDAEKVPGAISDHYIRAKRSRAAQQVVKVVMGAQAARHVETKP